MVQAQIDAARAPAANDSLHAGRELLFISYATEDFAFVRWLSLKLSACGYRVWWDRERLHGGASFPTDIDDAIKHRAFRVLAVLSNNSASKPNPERERSCALAIARERKEAFLIPLNIGLTPSELPWMVSNLTFVSFVDDWAAGLRQLLSDLRAAGAPCFPAEAAGLVRASLSQATFVVDAQEDVWLNVFPISELPLGISRYEWTHDVAEEPLGSWAHHREGPRACWAFEPPPEVPGVPRPARDQHALSSHRVNGTNLRHATSSLLRQYVDAQCRRRGLIEVDGGSRANLFYFPDTLPVASRLAFTLPGGRSTWIQPVGTRRVWHRGQPEQVQYHLAFSFRIELARFGLPVLQILPSVHFAAKANGARSVRRAKAVRRGWFNDKWLARISAIGSFLADGQSCWKIHPSLTTTVSAGPMRLRSAPSLDEAARSAALVVDDSEDAEDTDLRDEDDEGTDGDD